MHHQVSAGMWRLLTMNISVLPLLRLEQWQTIFDIVASGAEVGGFASIKSFEVIHTLSIIRSMYVCVYAKLLTFLAFTTDYGMVDSRASPSSRGSCVLRGWGQAFAS